MDRIDDVKLLELVRMLEQKRSAHYALGWLESMLKNMQNELRLTKRQTRMFNTMLDNNIRWAKD